MSFSAARSAVTLIHASALEVFLLICRIAADTSSAQHCKISHALSYLAEMDFTPESWKSANAKRPSQTGGFSPLRRPLLGLRHSPVVGPKGGGKQAALP